MKVRMWEMICAMYRKVVLGGGQGKGTTFTIASSGSKSGEERTAYLEKLFLPIGVGVASQCSLRHPQEWRRTPSAANKSTAYFRHLSRQWDSYYYGAGSTEKSGWADKLTG